MYGETFTLYEEGFALYETGFGLSEQARGLPGKAVTLSNRREICSLSRNRRFVRPCVKVAANC